MLTQHQEYYVVENYGGVSLHLHSINPLPSYNVYADQNSSSIRAPDPASPSLEQFIAMAATTKSAR